VGDGVRRKLDELKAAQDELKAQRSKVALARASELAAGREDGVVVARVDQLSPGELRDLAIAVRQQPGVRIAILGGETDSGGASLVAAVRPDTGLQASELIREAAKAVKGGGGGKGDIATAGGKDPSGLDDALGLARARATSLAIG
jgi:alanyl-tRNA synthetase